jgi:hypothetical protein
MPPAGPAASDTAPSPSRAPVPATSAQPRVRVSGCSCGW